VAVTLGCGGRAYRCADKQTTVSYWRPFSSYLTLELTPASSKYRDSHQPTATTWRIQLAWPAP